MTRRTPVAVAALTALGLTGPPVGAQRQVFSSRTLAVRVDALVTEGRKPVGGLKAADFELRDSGVLQTIDLVDSTDVPLNVVLALDTSASTTGKRLTDLVTAGETLLAGLKPLDRAALTTFSHAVAPLVPLTGRLEDVRRELRRVAPGGETSILDGAFVALMAPFAEPGRSLVVVCTDGTDTSSWLTADEVLAAAKRSSAVVYAVTAATPNRRAVLDELTEATGGQTIGISSSGDLRSAFERILTEFRSRYVLAYSPAGVSPDGYHRLDVRVRRSGVRVQARPGYTGLGGGGS